MSEVAGCHLVCSAGVVGCQSGVQCEVAGVSQWCRAEWRMSVRGAVWSVGVLVRGSVLAQQV